MRPTQGWKKRQNKPIGEIAKTLGVIRLIIGTICKTIHWPIDLEDHRIHF